MLRAAACLPSPAVCPAGDIRNSSVHYRLVLCCLSVLSYLPCTGDLIVEGGGFCGARTLAGEQGTGLPHWHAFGQRASQNKCWTRC